MAYFNSLCGESGDTENLFSDQVDDGQIVALHYGHAALVVQLDLHLLDTGQLGHAEHGQTEAPNNTELLLEEAPCPESRYLKTL